MPSVMTIEGLGKSCRFKLTRVYRGEREVKGCFPSRAAAEDFADMLNPIPCRGKKCWTTIVAAPPGVPRTVFHGRLGHGAEAHRFSTHTYDREFMQSFNSAEAAVKRNDCKKLFTALVGMIEAQKAYGVHAFSFRRGRPSRERRIGWMQKNQRRLREQFVTSCLPR